MKDIQEISKVAKQAAKIKKGKSTVKRSTAAPGSLGRAMKFKSISDASTIVKELEAMEQSVSPVLNI